eukprot:snap_masked-scaffold_46-processed-gene-1.43-mRNA-1 protein AED:1.00 eAED:1.00 QI:0/-1/0/0/-1/1/1/0/211
MLQIIDKETLQRSFRKEREIKRVMLKERESFQPLSNEKSRILQEHDKEMEKQRKLVKQNVWKDEEKKQKQLVKFLKQFDSTGENVREEMESSFKLVREERREKKERIYKHYKGLLYGVKDQQGSDSARSMIKRYTTFSRSKTRKMFPQKFWSKLQARDSTHCHFTKPNRKEASKNKKILSTVYMDDYTQLKPEKYRSGKRTDFSFLLKKRY